MSRLSAVGSVPIADRIKVFDTGGSKPRTRGKGVTPSSSPQTKLPPTPLTSLSNSSSGISMSQYSAKDPTSTRQSQSGASTPSRSSSRSSLVSEGGSGPPSLRGVTRVDSGHQQGVGGHQQGVGGHQAGVGSHLQGVGGHQAGVGGHQQGVGGHQAGVGSYQSQLPVNGQQSGVGLGSNKSSVGANLSWTGSLQPPVKSSTQESPVFREKSGSKKGNHVGEVTPEVDRTRSHNDSQTPKSGSENSTISLTPESGIGTSSLSSSLLEQEVQVAGRSIRRVNNSQDTVDRSATKNSNTTDIIIAEHVKQKEKNAAATEDHSMANNNVTNHRNANTFNNSNWSNGNSSATPTSVGREEKLSSINSTTSSCEELPSFTSSVTEEMDLVLGGNRRISGSGFGSLGREGDLEDQVTDLTQQVEMLFKVKQRMDVEMATLRKEHKREMADKDDELEDTRISTTKKVKMLELQLEQEHEERLVLVRERHDMEGKIMSLKDAIDHGQGEDQVRRLKKELRRNKALLKDAQILLDKNSGDGMNKIVLRQLKNQLEDAEFARTAAMKARQNCELELTDVQTQLEDISRAKSDLEERCVQLGREKGSLATQLRENEEEMAELIKKYKASVAASSTDQITIQDQAVSIQQLEVERNRAREQLAEMEQRVEHMRGESVSAAVHRRLELKQREMDNKLELEKTGRSRMETQVSRLKEALEKAGREAEQLRTKERQQGDEARKASKLLREMREDYSTLQGREAEWNQKRQDLEKQLELAEAETLAVRSDLKLASRRVEDLQAAIQGDMDSETDNNITSSDMEPGDSDEDDDEVFRTRTNVKNMSSLDKSNSSLLDSLS